MDEIKFQITQKIGTISQAKSGWATELNLVSWNEREPKYDIRSWDAEHKKMGKGITFTKEEIHSLKELLNSIEI